MFNFYSNIFSACIVIQEHLFKAPFVVWGYRVLNALTSIFTIIILFLLLDNTQLSTFWGIVISLLPFLPLFIFNKYNTPERQAERLNAFKETYFLKRFYIIFVIVVFFVVPFALLIASLFL